jgi:hypothetical protein
MFNFWRLAISFVLLLALAACSSNPARRISPPAASIQQLTVDASGNWNLSVRLQNYSGMPMHFGNARLAVSVDGQDAGQLVFSPGISIGPESADVVDATLTPSAMARIVVADTLASRRTLAYTLSGSISATPENKNKPKTFDIEASNSLNPAPGLDGVLR